VTVESKNDGAITIFHVVGRGAFLNKIDAALAADEAHRKKSRFSQINFPSSADTRAAKPAMKLIQSKGRSSKVSVALCPRNTINNEAPDLYADHRDFCVLSSRETQDKIDHDSWVAILMSSNYIEKKTPIWRLTETVWGSTIDMEAAGEDLRLTGKCFFQNGT
jgi:hypothetical protein